MVKTYLILNKDGARLFRSLQTMSNCLFVKWELNLTTISLWRIEPRTFNYLFQLSSQLSWKPGNHLPSHWIKPNGETSVLKLYREDLESSGGGRRHWNII